MLRTTLLMNLGLPEDTAFYVIHIGRRATLRVKMKEGALLLSYTGTDYSWLRDDATLNSLQLVLAPTDGSAKVPYREIRYRPDESYFSGGLIEQKRYAVIETITEIPSASLLDDVRERDKLTTWLATLLDRFVDWYRLITNDSDIPRPNIADAPAVELWVADDGTIDDDGSTGTFRPLSQTLQWKPPHVSGRGKRLIPQPSVVQLVEALRGDKTISLHERLLMDAREYSQLYHQHDISIVLSATALEVCARHHLVLACERLGVKTLTSGRGANVHQLPYEDAIEKGDVLEELLSKYPDKLVGFNLRQTSEYQAWHRDSYSPRRAILHRGRRGYSEAEARQAFGAVVAFMTLIAATLSR